MDKITEILDNGKKINVIKDVARKSWKREKQSRQKKPEALIRRS